MSRKTAEGFRDPLEDQGWQQMRILLDQEMPEEKRRLVWWPWLGATGTAVVLLFSGYQLFFKQSKEIDFDHAEITRVESSDKSIRTEMQANFDPVPSDQEINTAGVENKEKNINLKATQENESFNTKSTKSQANKGLASEKTLEVSKLKGSERNPNNSVVVSDPDPGATKTPNVKPTTKTSEPLVNVADDANMNDQKNVERSTEFYSLLDIPQFQLGYSYAINDFAPIDFENISSTISSEKRSKWDFSINTALTSNLNLGWAGFDGGAQLRYKLLRKLAINAGAFFWTIRSNQTFTSFASNDPNSVTFTRDDQNGALVAIPEMQNLDSTGKAQPGSISYVQTIKNLSYLRIPIFVQFFPESALQPYLGVNQIVLLSDGRQGLLESGANVDYASNGVSPEPFKDLVRLSNTGFILGITYQSGRHFNLDLSYTHSGKSYLKYKVSQGSFNEYHRFVRLGVGYRF